MIWNCLCKVGAFFHTRKLAATALLISTALAVSLTVHHSQSGSGSTIDLQVGAGPASSTTINGEFGVQSVNTLTVKVQGLSSAPTVTAQTDTLAEVTTVDTVADVAASLNGTHFVLGERGRTVHVYIDAVTAMSIPRQYPRTIDDLSLPR